jgi:transposase
MRAYSLDLRERVLAALDRGMSRAAAVTTFAVSLATIKRWLARRRAGESLAPHHSSGRAHTIPAAELSALRARLEAMPDASLTAHMQWWNDAHPNRPVSHATIDRAIARLGWTRKKRPSAPASGTKRSARHSGSASGSAAPTTS